MKRKSLAILLAAIVLLSGCKMKQPIMTPAPTQQAPQAQATGNSLVDISAQVPGLPEKFGGKALNEVKLKLYDIKTSNIKDVALNDYLCGVLAGEMRADWPMEALKAQAIIARTFLFQYLTENSKSTVNPDADISTDPKESQAYDASGINDNIRKAVSDTDGLVIAYQGKFIHAWFHSASGGVTADAVEGLNFKDGNPPYIVSVKSDESQASKEFTDWTGTFTTDEISAAIQKMGTAKTEGEISSFTIGKKGPSGRAETFVVNGQEISAPDFRTSMDPVKFRSTFITALSFDGSKLKVTGKGFGHGVGMPQWGAYTMANAGKTAQDIIKYYFKDVQIVKVGSK